MRVHLFLKELDSFHLTDLSKLKFNSNSITVNLGKSELPKKNFGSLSIKCNENETKCVELPDYEYTCTCASIPGTLYNVSLINEKSGFEKVLNSIKEDYTGTCVAFYLFIPILN
jgi:hypothetical protein